MEVKKTKQLTFYLNIYNLKSLCHDRVYIENILKSEPKNQLDIF